MDPGTIVLRHCVFHLPLNFRDILCGVAELKTQRLILLPERRKGFFNEFYSRIEIEPTIISFSQTLCRYAMAANKINLSIANFN